MAMHMKSDAGLDRRAFVAAVAAHGVLLATATWPLAGHASGERNAAAFGARSLDALYAALGLGPGDSSQAITLGVPDIAENGANVPVEIKVDIAGTNRVILIGEKNTYPLLMDVAWAAGGVPMFDVRIKLGESANVRVIALAGGKAYTAAKEVKVTIGGCAAG
jgi:sulfur-oxidizing protein SoxY